MSLIARTALRVAKLAHDRLDEHLNSLDALSRGNVRQDTALDALEQRVLVLEHALQVRTKSETRLLTRLMAAPAADPARDLLEDRLVTIETSVRLAVDMFVLRAEGRLDA